jgi:hypothetical protein
MHFTMRGGGNQNGRPGRPDDAVSNTDDAAIGQFNDCPQRPQPTTSANDGAAVGWDTPRNGSARDAGKIGVGEISAMLPPAGSAQTWLRMTGAIGCATNRDGWSREGGCHGWIRVNGRSDRTPANRTLRITNLHESVSASRKLDRTDPVDPDRTERIACPGSPHRNAASTGLQKSRGPRTVDAVRQQTSSEPVLLRVEYTFEWSFESSI